MAFTHFFQVSIGEVIKLLFPSLKPDTMSSDIRISSKSDDSYWYLYLEGLVECAAMSDDNNSRDNDYIHDSDNDRYYYEHYEGMDDYYSQSMGKGSIFIPLLILILFIVFLFVFILMVWLIKNIWEE